MNHILPRRLMIDRCEMIGYTSAQSPKSMEMAAQLRKDYPIVDLNAEPAHDPSKLDVILVLGGDGFMLRSAHRYMGMGVPLYGVNCGTVGFLLNDFDTSCVDLLSKIRRSYAVEVRPLDITLFNIAGESTKLYAVNEVSFLRCSHLALFIQVKVNHKIKINRLIADGLIVSTPIGSSAYNFSVGGPILPLYCNLLSVAPISPFRPRRWSGAIIPNSAAVELVLLDPELRRANASIDHQCFENITRIVITQSSQENKVDLLFDSQAQIEERMIDEQFLD